MIESEAKYYPNNQIRIILLEQCPSLARDVSGQSIRSKLYYGDGIAPRERILLETPGSLVSIPHQFAFATIRGKLFDRLLPALRSVASGRKDVGRGGGSGCQCHPLLSWRLYYLAVEKGFYRGTVLTRKTPLFPLKIAKVYRGFHPNQPHSYATRYVSNRWSRSSDRVQVPHESRARESRKLTKSGACVNTCWNKKSAVNICLNETSVSVS